MPEKQFSSQRQIWMPISFLSITASAGETGFNASQGLWQDVWQSLLQTACLSMQLICLWMQTTWSATMPFLPIWFRWKTWSRLVFTMAIILDFKEILKNRKALKKLPRRWIRNFLPKEISAFLGIPMQKFPTSALSQAEVRGLNFLIKWVLPKLNVWLQGRPLMKYTILLSKRAFISWPWAITVRKHLALLPWWIPYGSILTWKRNLLISQQVFDGLPAYGSIPDLLRTTRAGHCRFPVSIIWINPRFTEDLFPSFHQRLRVLETGLNSVYRSIEDF